MPPLIGNEIVWCVHNDGVPANLRRYVIDPIGIEVKQTLFASSNPELDNVIFLKYELTNSGEVNDVLDSVYFSFADDTDIGDATDDLGGCDTLLNSIFTYNSPVDAFYGNNPPAVFTTLLQGPVQESTNNSDTAFIGMELFLVKKFFKDIKTLAYIHSQDMRNLTLDKEIRKMFSTFGIMFTQKTDRAICLIHVIRFMGKFMAMEVDCNEVNPMFWFSGDPVEKVGWLDKTDRDDR